MFVPFQWWLAPVGHRVTQVALEQWLQRSERNSVVSCGYFPWVASTIQSLFRPSGTLFSVLQATTQSPQPMQVFVSITMANRVISDLLRRGL
jgi:hypothetical protein